MTYVTDEVKAFIGFETELGYCCDVVERGAVRRFSQAIMDPDPVYMDDKLTAGMRYGGPVAPPLYPLTQIRIPFGSVDVVSLRAEDPHFDGTGVLLADNALPPLPLGTLGLLNGGSEVELFRYLRHGEALAVKHRYADIYERESSKGPIVIVITETDYVDDKSEVVARIRRTTIRK